MILSVTLKYVLLATKLQQNIKLQIKLIVRQTCLENYSNPVEFPQEGHEPDTPGLLFDKHIQKWNFSCLSNIFRKLERFKWDFQEHEEADTRVNGKFCRVSRSPKFLIKSEQ